jgi:hypothetical protein
MMATPRKKIHQLDVLELGTTAKPKAYNRDGLLE